MLKNVALIGKGKWGLILKKKLKKISNLVFICGKDYKTKKYDNIDWVFIATPDETHSSILKFFVKKKINIFCEKPLVRDFKVAKKILEKYKKQKIKIYISDVLFYLKRKFILKRINRVFRSKRAKYNLEEILYKLTYHDIYFCYNYLYRKKIIIKKNFTRQKLILNLKADNNSFIFEYDLNHNKKIHTYNSRSISRGQDPLNIMLNKILYSKVNYSKNHERSIFTLNLIDKIKRY